MIGNMGLNTKNGGEAKQLTTGGLGWGPACQVCSDCAAGAGAHNWGAPPLAKQSPGRNNNVDLRGTENRQPIATKKRGMD